MARRLFRCALVLLAPLSLAAADTNIPASAPLRSTVLKVTMINECAADGEVLSMATSEAARIWSSAAVDVRWVASSELPYRSSRADWLVVRCVAEPATRAGSSAARVVTIASIRFLGSLPTNTITVSMANAVGLLEQDARATQDLNERFRPLKQRRLGRMIGRAIAHEIGHFLSQSEAHTPTGLMRATHTVSALVGESISPFKVGPATLR